MASAVSYRPDFQCFVKGSYSDLFPVGVGVPQGSPLSPLLFSVMFANLPDMDSVVTSTFADDLAFIVVQATLKDVRTSMQNTHPPAGMGFRMGGCQLILVNLAFKFLQSAYLIISHYPIITEPSCVWEHKLLGVYLDIPRLNWSRHVSSLQVECSKRLDILKCVSSSR